MLFWNNELEAWIPECVRITGRKKLEPEKHKNGPDLLREFKELRELEKSGEVIMSMAAIQAEKKRIKRSQIKERKI